MSDDDDYDNDDENQNCCCRLFCYCCKYITKTIKTLLYYLLCIDNISLVVRMAFCFFVCVLIIILFFFIFYNYFWNAEKFRSYIKELIKKYIL